MSRTAAESEFQEFQAADTETAKLYAIRIVTADSMEFSGVNTTVDGQVDFTDPIEDVVTVVHVAGN